MATNNVGNTDSNVPLSGATLVGTLELNGDPTTGTQAANKNYIDSLTPTVVAVPTIPGNWYSNLYTITASNSNTSPITGTIYYYPFISTYTADYDGIGVFTSGATTGNVNMGVYADSGAAQPTGSPLSGTMSGTVATAINSLISYTFSSPVSLSPGIYWLAIAISVNSSYRGPSSLANLRGLGLAESTPFGNDTVNTVVKGWSEAFVYSATLPSVGGSLVNIPTVQQVDMYIRAN